MKCLKTQDCGPKSVFARTGLRFASVVCAAVLLLGSSLSAQWLETTIPLPDSLNGVSHPNLLAFNSGNDLIYVGGTGNSTIITVDGISRRKGTRLSLPGGIEELCYAPAENKFYCRVSNSTLAVVDAAASRIIGTINVGTYPAALCYNPVEHKVYSATSPDRTVSIVDARVDSVIATLPVHERPTAICCDDIGNKVYVAEAYSGYIRAIDGAGDTLLDSVYVSEMPRALLFNPISNKLYSPDESFWDLGIVDARADTVIRWLTLYGGNYDMCLNSRENKVYVANHDLSKLHIVCGYGDTMIAEIPLGGAPTDVIYDSLDNLVYVACSNTDSIFVVDGVTDQIVARFMVAAGPYSLCLDPLQRRLYTANSAGGDMSVIRVPDNQIEQRIGLWFGPGAACYCPQSDAICIASPDVRQVAILDPATNRLRSTVFVPATVGSMINVASLGKLYCASSGSSDSLVSVIDPDRDSLLRTIPVPEGLSFIALRTNGTPKLYGVSEAEQILSVINALLDTVVARIPLVRNVLAAVYDSLDDRMFCVCEGDRNVWVFNCRSDSFVAWRWLATYPIDLCYVPGHNYICVANENDSLVVIDASTLAILAEIPLLGYPRRVQYCDRDDKVYCLLYDTLLAAVSMPLLQIVSRPRVPAGLNRMLYDSIANRLYCLAKYEGTVAVLDCDADTIVTTLTTGSTISGFAWSPGHRRMYITDEPSSAVAVILDSAVTGVTDGQTRDATRLRPFPAIIRGVLFVPRLPTPDSRSPIALLDISGRKVLDLQPGPNDVSRLAPGVYFLSERSAVSGQRSAVAKVVITK